MPVCVIGYKPGHDREDLAVELLKALPDMIVEVMVTVADVRLTPAELDIDLVAFHPAAYNKSDLEVVVQVSRGDNDSVFNVRERIRDCLYRLVNGWLRKRLEACCIVEVTTATIDIRFMDMCGVAFDAATGHAVAEWNGKTAG